MAKDNKCKLPLQCAALGGSVSAIEVLLKARVDANGKDAKERSPLHEAARSRSFSRDEMLAQNGC
jgi:ankyrin repeat protein